MINNLGQAVISILFSVSIEVDASFFPISHTKRAMPRPELFSFDRLS